MIVTPNQHPNPSLVAAKKKQLTQKQQKWQKVQLQLSVFKLDGVPVEGQSGTVEDPRCPTSPRPVKCVKLNQSTQENKACLPKGLIGSKCTAQVNVAGQACQCLLDTGSQVTTIPVSFYNAHLSHQPVKPLCDLLQVEGAAGQSIPYLGYIEMTIMFPSDFLGADLVPPSASVPW